MVSKQHAVLEHAVLDIERSRTVRAFAAFAPAQALQPWTYELEALGTGEIDVAGHALRSLPHRLALDR